MEVLASTWLRLCSKRFIADRLGAGHVRVFAGGIPKGGTEVQAVDWAIEVYKPALDYAGTKGILLGLEDDDELTRTADQLLAILKKTDHPFARINLDCGNFRKDGYKESRALRAIRSRDAHQNEYVVARRQSRSRNCSAYSRMPATEVTFRWSSSLMIKTTQL
jgi:sugar phosphate isomerase/epimerase